MKDKSQALMYFAKKFGYDHVEPEVKDEVIKEILQIEENHLKKYGLKGKTVVELRKEMEEG